MRTMLHRDVEGVFEGRRGTRRHTHGEGRAGNSLREESEDGRLKANGPLGDGGEKTSGDKIRI